MSRLDQEPEIVSLANDLQLSWTSSPVESILSYCRDRIGRIYGGSELSNLDELLQAVGREVQIEFVEFTTDDELSRIAREYATNGDPAFLAAAVGWTEDTFATLLERRGVKSSAKDRYVALIDCRGDKVQRRYFTKWHEIAHLLTLVRQLEFPFHRSTVDRDPIERLMDLIAGEIGFFKPIAEPIVDRIVAEEGTVTINAVERIREEACPDASFHATLIATARLANVPVIVLEAGLGLKKAEQRIVASKQADLFPMPKPTPKLRALSARSNDPASEIDFTIHRNMEIPPDSVVTQCFVLDDENGEIHGEESLTTWTHSDGAAIGSTPVRIEARRHHDRVLAVVTPVARPA